MPRITLGLKGPDGREFAHLSLHLTNEQIMWLEADPENMVKFLESLMTETSNPELNLVSWINDFIEHERRKNEYGG